MTPLLFSVIIPTYNRKESLTRCLDALAAQTLPASAFEVIVVDDGSNDGTAEFVRARQTPFTLSCVRVEHGGPSVARNLGAKLAKGQVLAFTEDDVLPRHDWLSNARRQFDVLHPVFLEGRTVRMDLGEDVRRFEREQRPAFLPCNLFIERAAFEAAGGYDPAFFSAEDNLYFREDADLGFRLLDRGCAFMIGGDVIVEHPPQFASVAQCFRHVRRYVFDALLYRKHPLRYRMMIERKDVLGMTVHRPMHYIAVIYIFLLIWALWMGVAGDLAGAGVALVLACCCAMLFRFRYQEKKALSVYRIGETAGFLVLPLVYLRALVEGCIRYKTLGPLL